MSKSPATGADMRSTIYDYEWKEVGAERGGPVKGIKEKLLSVDVETGAYTRIVIFAPGFRFKKALQHPFWEELYLLEGHMTDYGTNTVYTKGFYALRPAGIVHGPFGTDLGCMLLETTWFDKDWYLSKHGKS